MASKLYNYLKNIDITREDMIEALREQGAVLPDDASLSLISSTLKSFNLSQLEDDEYYETYYDNPEDDPEVWTPYSIRDTIDAIWDTLTPYTDANGIKFYPCEIIALKCEEPTILFTGTTSTYFNAANAFTSNRLNLFYVYSSIGTAATYNYKMLVKTIDGPEYMFDAHELKASPNDASGQTHTWDDEHFIEDTDGNKYKYVITYISLSDYMKNRTSYSDNRYLGIGPIAAGASIEIPYCVINPHFCAYQVALSHYKTKLYHVRYNCNPTRINTTAELNALTEYKSVYTYPRGLMYGYTSSYTNGNYWPKTLKRFELDPNTSFTSMYYATPQGSGTSDIAINTFITTLSPKSNSYRTGQNPDLSYAMPKYLVYIKAPCVHPSYLARQNEAVCSLKYLVLTNTPEQCEQYMLENPCKHDIQNPDSSATHYRCRNYIYPRLRFKDIEFMIGHLNEIYGLMVSNKTPIKIQGDRLQIFKPAGSRCTDSLHCSVLIMAQAKALPSPIGSTGANVIDYADTLYLPNVTELNLNTQDIKTKNLYVPSLQRLILTAPNTNALVMEVFEAPALTEFTVSGNYSAANTYLGISPYVRKLVFGEGFKFSLQFNSNYNSLDMNCFYDLAQKAATLEASERGVYKITNASKLNNLHPLYEPARQMFIDKGWTVS